MWKLPTLCTHSQWKSVVRVALVCGAGGTCVWCRWHVPLSLNLSLNFNILTQIPLNNLSLFDQYKLQLSRVHSQVSSSSVDQCIVPFRPNVRGTLDRLPGHLITQWRHNKLTRERLDIIMHILCFYSLISAVISTLKLPGAPFCFVTFGWHWAAVNNFF